MKMPEYVVVKIISDKKGTSYSLEVVEDTDFVNVVRCKDCDNAMYTENGDIFCDGIRDANWFCADGEKKVTP